MMSTPVDVDRYRSSADYSSDLTATRKIWANHYVLATSGTFVFLTYLASPTLIAARSDAGNPARSVLDGNRERDFLLRFLGLTDRKSWQGGVANVRVLRQVQQLGERHSQFTGMRQEYMDFIGAIIALAPLRVREAGRIPPTVDDRERYWRYISNASAAMGSNIGSEAGAENSCRNFVAGYSGASADGARLLLSLMRHHADHVRQAMPLLFDDSRVVIERLLLGES
jgi:hypothetical protein